MQFVRVKVMQTDGSISVTILPVNVENEKGLMIDFRLSDYSLDAAALNGVTAGLGLNNVDLGTIAARSSSVAQWWLTSTLQGHFSGMRASLCESR